MEIANVDANESKANDNVLLHKMLKVMMIVLS